LRQSVWHQRPNVNIFGWIEGAWAEERAYA